MGALSIILLQQMQDKDYAIIAVRGWRYELWAAKLQIRFSGPYILIFFFHIVLSGEKKCLKQYAAVMKTMRRNKE